MMTRQAFRKAEAPKEEEKKEELTRPKFIRVAPKEDTSFGVSRLDMGK